MREKKKVSVKGKTYKVTSVWKGTGILADRFEVGDIVVSLEDGQSTPVCILAENYRDSLANSLVNAFYNSEDSFARDYFDEYKVDCMNIKDQLEEIKVSYGGEDD